MSEGSDYEPSDGEEYGSDLEGSAYESGYTTGITTGTEDDASDFFDEQQDPFDLLDTMEQQHPRDGEVPEPYELLRQRRAQGQQATTTGAEEEAGPSKGGSRYSTFGADVDELMQDPVLGRSQKKKHRRRGRKRGVGRSRVIPEEVSKKMGQANLLYSTNKLKEAVELLKQVVRAVPNLPDPYFTLAEIHELEGSNRKALDFRMIAAHIAPKDVDQWQILAERSQELGFYRQAIYCYNKVLSRNKTDFKARFTRAMLYAELNAFKRALDQFEVLAKQYPEDGDIPIQCARIHHRLKAPQKGIDGLEHFIARSPKSVELTHINILAELYLEQGNYMDAYQLVQRAVKGMCEEGQVPVDLSVKAGLALVHLGRVQEATAQLSQLLSEEPQHYIDLLQDVAAALQSQGAHEEAVPYWEKLNSVTELSGPTTWASLADALRLAGRAAAAVALYESKIVTLALDSPDYLEVSLALCELWVETGLTEKVAGFLGNLDYLLEKREVGMPDGAQRQMALFVRKSRLHLLSGSKDTFVSSMLPVVSDSLTRLETATKGTQDPTIPVDMRRALSKRQIRVKQRKSSHATSGEDTDSVFHGYKVRDRRKAHVVELDNQAEQLLQDLEAAQEDGQAGASGDGLRDNGLARHLLTDEDTFQVFVKLCEELVDGGRSDEANALLVRAIQLGHSKSLWVDKGKRDLVKLMLVDLQIARGEYKKATEHLKHVVARWPFSLKVWNQYCNIYGHLGVVKHWVKYVTALSGRHPTSLPLMLLQGHVALLSREYRKALSEYYHVYRYLKDEPLVLLCIGCAYVSMALTKKVEDRNRCVLQGFAFLGEYHRLRKNPQESFFNMGRAAHQLGLMNIALAFYRNALKSPPPSLVTPQPSLHLSPAVHPGNLDLTREIAHNLVLVYRASGAVELAREVVRRYLVV